MKNYIKKGIIGLILSNLTYGLVVLACGKKVNFLFITMFSISYIVFYLLKNRHDLS